MQQKIRTWVNHPRYGKKPMKSYFKYTDEEVIDSFYHKRIANDFFLKSAIPVDVSNLNNPYYPKSFYVDIELTCTQCKRAFLFFALEQKYWYEELKFPVDAQCQKCIDCRNNEKGIKELHYRYDELLEKENLTDKEIKELKHAVLELYQIGVIKHKYKVDVILYGKKYN